LWESRTTMESRQHFSKSYQPSRDYNIVPAAVDSIPGTLSNYFVILNYGKLTVTQEDARATYTGAVFASTSSKTSGAATVTLAATIQDITAVTDDPAYDPDAGDIRNAVVKFVNGENGDVICTASVGLVNPVDTKTGTATCNWDINIGTQDSEQYTIGIIVNNYYIRIPALMVCNCRTSLMW
jgi:hypothetical protein